MPTAAAPVEGKPKSFAGNDGGDAGQGTPDGRSTSREARRVEPQAAARVSVISEQAVPAPAAASLSANGAAIVDAIGSRLRLARRREFVVRAARAEPEQRPTDA